MPSWNIHIAQTEALMERGGAVPHAVHDQNIFLFGNVVPDIFVGYMLEVDHIIKYTETHCAKTEPIPKPREWEFWDRFVVPAAAAAGLHARPSGLPWPGDGAPAGGDGAPTTAAGAAPVPAAPSEPPASALENDVAHPARDILDLTLGAWAHLVADNVWNTRVHEYLTAHGGVPSDSFRVKKQSDFDSWGKTLRITSVPRETPALVAAAERFPQYPIAPNYTHDTIVVIHEIVRTNGGNPVHAPYQLLCDEFFDSTFNEVLDTTERLLTERLSGLRSC